MNSKDVTAVYARYSSDLQSNHSIDDQISNCKRFADRKGLKITRTYKDEALSGTSTNRPGYQQMLKDAQNGLFSVLLIDDLSRFGRDVYNNMGAIKQLQYIGVRIFAVSEGYDSHDSSTMSDFTPIFKGMVDEMYIKELAQKTKRGLNGQFNRGFSTGGAVYGYRTVPVYDEMHVNKKAPVGFKYEIIEEEAKVIQQIFQFYVDGHTPRSIAQKLNNLNITSPGGKAWAGSTIQPHLKRGTGLLLQAMYNGQRVWNKTHSKRNPITGKRKQIQNPMDVWEFQNDESLRIVPVELWQKAQNRIRSVNEQTEKQRDGIKKSGGRRPGGTLLSGLLKCSECGGNLIVSGRNHYACSAAINKGTCGNKAYIKKTAVEQQILRWLSELLNTEENIDVFVKEVTKALKADGSDDKRQQLKQSQKEVSSKIDNLIEAVKSGMKYELIKTDLEELEKRREDIAIELESKAKNSGGYEFSVEEYKSILLETVMTLTQYKDYMPKSRELLSKLINGEIILREKEKASEYEASLEFDPCSLIPNEPSQEIMVAGAGFEPTIFGL